LRELDRKKKAA